MGNREERTWGRGDFYRFVDEYAQGSNLKSVQGQKYAESDRRGSAISAGVAQWERRGSFISASVETEKKYSWGDKCQEVFWAEEKQVVEEGGAERPDSWVGGEEEVQCCSFEVRDDLKKLITSKYIVSEWLSILTSSSNIYPSFSDFIRSKFKFYKCWINKSSIIWLFLFIVTASTCTEAYFKCFFILPLYGAAFLK